MHETNSVGSVTKPGRRLTLSVLAEARLRDELRKQAPSEPWVEAQLIDVAQRDDRGDLVIRRIHDASVFPPGGVQTRMVRCAICGIFTPPGAMEEGHCLDHGEHDNWGPSPSAVVIRQLQYRNLRVPESELPPESTGALLLEIEEHERASRGET